MFRYQYLQICCCHKKLLHSGTTNVFGLVRLNPPIDPSDMYTVCNADVALLYSFKFGTDFTCAGSSNFGTVGLSKPI